MKEFVLNVQYGVRPQKRSTHNSGSGDVFISSKQTQVCPGKGRVIKRKDQTLVKLYKRGRLSAVTESNIALIRIRVGNTITQVRRNLTGARMKPKFN